MVDIESVAAEAPSFEAFKAQVERFFRETNRPTLAEWEEAVAEVRQGRTEADWLPKKSAESPAALQVLLLEHPELARFDPAQRRLELDRMLGPGGFSSARDIAAITVNRWSHGYGYVANSLFDPDDSRMKG